MAGDEWIECKLADACSSIDYGLTASAADAPIGPRFLRITDIVGGAVNWNAVPHVAADDETTAKYRLENGDLVLARTGASTGASAYIKDPPKAVFASYLVRLKAGPAFDSRFLSYYLRSEPFWTFLRGVLGDKSAQPNASASTMTKAPLRAPRSKDTQRAIAHILGSLDDKIDLNRRTNETLEALARAIFDGEFGSEASHATVGDLAEIERDSVSPMEHEEEWFDHYSLPAFDESRRPVRERGIDIKSNKFVIQPSAVLISKLNPSIPRVWYTRIGREHRSIASTEFQVMRSRETSSPEFLYCLLRSEPVREHLVGLASGTSNSHQRVKPDDLLATAAPKPSTVDLDRFTRTTLPMFERVTGNLDESHTLATLRDTLLPKLLSGELRIPDAEKLVETAHVTSADPDRGEVVVYEAPDGSVRLDVRLERDTVWLSQRHIAELLDTSTDNVGLHLKNVYAEKELDEAATTEESSAVRVEGRRKVRRTVRLYNLDAILSVGYRVSSKRGTQFRIWATRTLRDHLLRGYTLNERRLREKGLGEMEQAVGLLAKTLTQHALVTDEGRAVLGVVQAYTRAWRWLLEYDEGRLAESPTRPRAPAAGLTLDSARAAVASLREDLAGRGDATALFGKERGEQLAGLLGAIEQTFGGKPLYPTAQVRAAHVLYFVIKDHPFSDGNKRIGTLLFLEYLRRNELLTRRDGSPRLADNAMVALALLVAESEPKQKDLMVRLILNLIEDVPA